MTYLESTAEFKEVSKGRRGSGRPKKDKPEAVVEEAVNLLSEEPIIFEPVAAFPNEYFDENTSEESHENTGYTVLPTQLGVYPLGQDVSIPKFQTELSACFDLAAWFKQGDKIKCISSGQESFRKVTDKGLIVHQGDRFLIPTGLVFDIPEGYCLEIYPRSGISYRHGISLNNCTAIIDADYVEQVYISVNVMGNSQYIKSGERIAQAKLVQLVDTEINVLNSKPEPKSSRQGGFGSTGSR